MPGLELFLELLRVRLTVRDTLLTPRELLSLGVELRLALLRARLGLGHLNAVLLHLAVDLGPQQHGLLAGLDQRLPTRRLGLALGVREQRAALILGQTQPRGTHGPEPHPEPGRAYRDSDQSCDDREHGRSLLGLSRGDRRGCSHPDTACTGGIPVYRSSGARYLGRDTVRGAAVAARCGGIEE